jgi:hypothetical protein
MEHHNINIMDKTRPTGPLRVIKLDKNERKTIGNRQYPKVLPMQTAETSFSDIKLRRVYIQRHLEK